MNIKEVKLLTPIERFVYWVQERESIRLKKEAGEPPPWTDDEVLMRHRFCNVRRMDDKVSRWLTENWYNPYFDHPNMLVAICLARFFNLPSTLEAIGFPETWEPKRIKATVRGLKRSGATVYNAAYMVRGNNGVDKVSSVIDFNIQPLVKLPPVIHRNSMRLTWMELECRYGFGSFMAGQVVADLRWAVKGSWADRRRWAPMGPGSRRGIERATGVAPTDQKHFLYLLKELVNCVKPQLPKSITRRMEMHDFQNCCCEYDKYSRTLLGEGRPKQIYEGGLLCQS